MQKTKSILIGKFFSLFTFGSIGPHLPVLFLFTISNVTNGKLVNNNNNQAIFQYIEEPSLSALKVKQEKEEEMKKLEDYWKVRLQNQQVSS